MRAVSRHRVISYQSPEPEETPGREGVAGLALGIAALCLLLALILSVRYRWVEEWQSLMLVAVFVVAMLGLIAVPTARWRSAFALSALLLNASCLASLPALLLLYRWIGNAG